MLIIHVLLFSFKALIPFTFPIPCPIQRIEREATYSYQTLTVPEDKAANVIYLNGTLIHNSPDEIPESTKVRIAVFYSKVRYIFLLFLLSLIKILLPGVCREDRFSKKGNQYPSSYQTRKWTQFLLFAFKTHKTYPKSVKILRSPHLFPHSNFVFQAEMLILEIVNFLS